uniref:Metastriate one of each protein family n=1 Tax=Rhipicephalus zambeziensis TaxID=60191 RepID=A0A224YJT6_9ACAR
MKELQAGFAVWLLCATMAQGQYKFDADVNDYVDVSLGKLKDIIDEKTTKNPVVIKDFVRPSNDSGSTVVVPWISLGVVKGLDTLRRAKKCKVTEKTERYNVRCPIKFLDLECVLPRLNKIKYTLKVGVDGIISFRLYKGPAGNVQRILLIIKNFTLTLDQELYSSNGDAVVTFPTVPSAYNPDGTSIGGPYSDALRYYLTQKLLITYIKKALVEAYPTIKNKIK